MANPLKVAFIHYRDGRSVRSWSGIPAFSKQAFHRYVGPVVDLSPAPISLFPFRVIRKLVLEATGKMYSYDHDPALARLYGLYFSRLLAREKPDLIYSPAGSPCLAYLDTDVPIVYYSDATWRVIRDYYPNYSNVVGRTARGGEELESRAIARSTVALYSSDWAAESAVRDYGADPAKVHNVHIGANLVAPPTRSEVLPRRLSGAVRLLFVGVLWEVKGGQIAYETLLRLLELGYDATLTIVGCTPPAGISHPRMEVIPFLNKQVPAEKERFERLWYEADIFLLPSRCEAAGVVFCEASAHGMPSLSTRTGGVPSIIVDGENGYTLPFEAGGTEYARKIAEIVDDPARYSRLCETSRDAFEQRLSWDAWGERVASIVAERIPAYRDRIAAWQSRSLAAK